MSEGLKKAAQGVGLSTLNARPNQSLRLGQKTEESNPG
jgi:hypothetical protein